MLCANGGPMKCRITCDKCREIFKAKEKNEVGQRTS